jgi:hypothetical protein
LKRGPPLFPSPKGKAKPPKADDSFPGMICYVKDGEIRMMNWYLVLLFSFLGSEIKSTSRKQNGSKLIVNYKII